MIGALAAPLAAAVQAPALPALPAQPPVREVQLGGLQLFRLAEQAERGGDPGLAERAYAALAADRQPTLRREARFRLARLLAGRADWTGSARMLRTILDEEPGAARVRLELAGILARLGDEASARRELRAAQAARPPAALARLIDRFAAGLRSRRPVSASMTLALAPDSNINRATTGDRLETVIGDFDIDDAGKARSGIGLSLEGSAQGRIELGRRVAVIVQAGGRALRYRQERFNRQTLVGRAGVQLALGGGALSVTLAGQQHRLGGAVALTSKGVEVEWARPVARRSQLRLGGGVAGIDNRFNPLEDGRLVNGRVALDHALSPATGVTLSLAASRRTARVAAYSTRAADLLVEGWHELGPVTLSLSAGAGRLRADERLALLPRARRDTSLLLGAGVTSRRFSWRGLAPSLRVGVERVRSTIAFHELKRRTLEIGLTRAF